MRFVKYCIPFLFTICTVSQLFWNQVCKFRQKYYNVQVCVHLLQIRVKALAVVCVSLAFISIIQAILQIYIYMAMTVVFLRSKTRHSSDLKHILRFL